MGWGEFKMIQFHFFPTLQFSTNERKQLSANYNKLQTARTCKRYGGSEEITERE